VSDAYKQAALNDTQLHHTQVVETETKLVKGYLPMCDRIWEKWALRTKR